MDYETFGEHQKEYTGIFDFLKALPEAILVKVIYVLELFWAEPISLLLRFMYNIHSWADERIPVPGNELQNEASTRSQYRG